MTALKSAKLVYHPETVEPRERVLLDELRRVEVDLFKPCPINPLRLANVNYLPGGTYCGSYLVDGMFVSTLWMPSLHLQRHRSLDTQITAAAQLARSIGAMIVADTYDLSYDDVYEKFANLPVVHQESWDIYSASPYGEHNPARFPDYTKHVYPDGDVLTLPAITLRSVMFLIECPWCGDQDGNCSILHNLICPFDGMTTASVPGTKNRAEHGTGPAPFP